MKVKITKSKPRKKESRKCGCGEEMIWDKNIGWTCPKYKRTMAYQRF